MPTWRSVLQSYREERDTAELALRRAIEDGDLDASDFARIWLGDAQSRVDDLEERYRDQL